MKTNKIAVFPGSFDPITVGHVDIVLRSLPLFDKIIVAVGVNTNKNSLYDLDTRVEWIKKVFQSSKKVEVKAFTGLTINFCRDVNAHYLLRGIRSSADFEYEKTIAHLNKDMAPEIETILVLSKPELGSISSTIVREILKGNGDVKKFVPKEIYKDIKKFKI